jgi:hypothetical protein
MKKVFRFIAVAGLIALASGCSIKRVAVNKLGSPPLCHGAAALERV